MMVGSAGLFLAALSVGSAGTISALANIAGEELSQIQKEFSAGDLINARSVQLRLIDLNSTITSRLGVAGLKYALDLLGYKGGYARSPLLPLMEEQKEQVRGALDKAGLLKLV